MNSLSCHILLYLWAMVSQLKHEKLLSIISNEKLHVVPDAHDYLKSSGFSQSLQQKRYSTFIMPK